MSIAAELLLWPSFQSCEDAIGMICGYNPDNINNTRLPLYLSYTPAGTSVKNMAHWSQVSKLPTVASRFPLNQQTPPSARHSSGKIPYADFCLFFFPLVPRPRCCLPSLGGDSEVCRCHPRG